MARGSVVVAFACVAVAGACQGRTREGSDPTAAPSAADAPSADRASGSAAAGRGAPLVGSAVAEAAAPTPSTRPTNGKAKAAPTDGVGHLERAAALEPLFHKLSELEAGRATSDVRILQLGDSHTASDYGTSVLRRKLKERFGDGGRGFLPLGEPYKRLFQDGELVSSGVDFHPEEVRQGGHYGDGRFGLGGIAMAATKASGRMVSRYGVPATSLELAYLEQPGGGSFEVLVDGHVQARIETKRDVPRSAFRLFDVEAKPHVVDVRARGDGEARIFGVALDDKRIGIVLDSLGINGAKAQDGLGQDEAHVVEQLRHRSPALVIYAYGTNELGDGTTPDEHEAALVQLQGRLARAQIGSACLFLGPPDRAAKAERGWTTMPKLEPILAAQRRAAAKAGCAFYDQLGAMGGPGTMHVWAGEPKARARKDHVHFTRDGYAQLATSLAGDLVAAYEAWKAQGAPR